MLRSIISLKFLHLLCPPAFALVISVPIKPSATVNIFGSYNKSIGNMSSANYTWPDDLHNLSPLQPIISRNRIRHMNTRQLHNHYYNVRSPSKSKLLRYNSDYNESHINFIIINYYT